MKVGGPARSARILVRRIANWAADLRCGKVLSVLIAPHAARLAGDSKPDLHERGVRGPQAHRGVVVHGSRHRSESHKCAAHKVRLLHCPARDSPHWSTYRAGIHIPEDHAAAGELQGDAGVEINVGEQRGDARCDAEMNRAPGQTRHEEPSHLQDPQRAGELAPPCLP
ncbi:hypothetical protein FOMPIDRAFT_1054317 [Fomitopsis schrenkii]|uniref:Uncharacterized protein n=1 Tax=Fomitopsis schrenkii TaxID=2126942 RepID=S8F9L3_FOMSC|nr:hypothetical protein FOMPIDRAFT_1054317 [Fomitopsis schrenkii]